MTQHSTRTNNDFGYKLMILLNCQDAMIQIMQSHMRIKMGTGCLLEMCLGGKFRLYILSLCKL